MEWLLALALAASNAAPSVASYQIQVELRPQERALVGTQHVVWMNPAPAPARTLQFHLYLNAFRDARSSFFAGMEWPRERWQGIEDPWGWIEIEELRIAGGEDIAAAGRFLAPDDGNEHDRTVAEFPLPRPVEPGAKLEIDVRFRARIPRIYTRTGMRGDFFFLAQWFPQLGVYEAEWALELPPVSLHE
jgi:hypothetical protein